MFDTHNHMIYGVDDGSKNIETSIEVLSNLYEQGIKNVILTPHYIPETNYVSSKLENYKKLMDLRNELRKRNINMNLYLGNEIYIDKNIVDYICKNVMSTLNNSEYILVELPMNGIYEDYIDIFSNLINTGFKVILAHPERYTTFQGDYSKILELEEIGVLFQCNIGSILGEYGNGAKKLIKRLLKDKKVSFIGTDIHSKKDNYNYIDKAIKKFLRYLSVNEINNILYNNPKKIIDERG